jgi:hypothetical protein
VRATRRWKRNAPLTAPATLVSAVLLLAALIGLELSAAAGQARATEAIVLDFEATAVGGLPPGFSTAVTGGGGPAAWSVVEDPTAPSGRKVLAQTSTDRTSYRFPLCIYDRLSAADVAVSVAFKPVSGTVDQAAGLVARLKDKDNYITSSERTPSSTTSGCTRWCAASAGSSPAST